MIINSGFHEPHPEKNIIGFAEAHVFPQYEKGKGIVWSFKLNIFLRFY